MVPVQFGYLPPHLVHWQVLPNSVEKNVSAKVVHLGETNRGKLFVLFVSKIRCRGVQKN
jgi:hypothetical protein